MCRAVFFVMLKRPSYQRQPALFVKFNFCRMLEIRNVAYVAC